MHVEFPKCAIIQTMFHNISVRFINKFKTSSFRPISTPLTCSPMQQQIPPINPYFRNSGTKYHSIHRIHHGQIHTLRIQQTCHHTRNAKRTPLHLFLTLGIKQPTLGLPLTMDLRTPPNHSQTLRHQARLHIPQPSSKNRTTTRLRNTHQPIRTLLPTNISHTPINHKAIPSQNHTI